MIEKILKNKLFKKITIVSLIISKFFMFFFEEISYSEEESTKITFDNGTTHTINTPIINTVSKYYEGYNYIDGHYAGLNLYDSDYVENSIYPLKSYSILNYEVDGNEINSQLQSTAVAIGSHSMSAQGGVSIGSYSKSTKEAVFGVNVGFQARTEGLSSIAVGAGSLGKGRLSQAYGRNSTAIGDESIAQGTASLSKSKGAIALGTVATASGENAIAIGSSDMKSENSSYKYQDDKTKRTDASGKNSIALGHMAQASKKNTLALGKGANASIDKSVALGSESITTEAKATKDAKIGDITYSGFAGNNPNSVVSIGSKDKERQLQNVASGQINDKSTDAINGSQLYATNMVIGTLATSKQY
ncbi:hypothetical protein [Streptobacillus ratti]|uniref:hypothetical protein n=1 Tax=Streptobacillus ratti TaxID=1720557 RepID=UPI0009342AF4|nr:hypothetical protein [Streptobacillus ratti]